MSFCGTDMYALTTTLTLTWISGALRCSYVDIDARNTLRCLASCFNTIHILFIQSKMILNTFEYAFLVAMMSRIDLWMCVG